MTQWPPETDESLALWMWACHHWPITIEKTTSVLEIGACESTFHETIREFTDDYTGIDVRAQSHLHPWAIQADVQTWEPDRRFDLIVLIGTLEHIGLGYVDYKDHVDPDGDVKTVNRCQRWLTPGGLLYYDVPHQPTPSIPKNRHFRIYSGRLIDRRLSGVPPTHVSSIVGFQGQLVQQGLVELGRIYTPGGQGKLAPMAEPVEPATNGIPYYLCGRLLSMPASMEGW